MHTLNQMKLKPSSGTS